MIFFSVLRGLESSYIMLPSHHLMRSKMILNPLEHAFPSEEVYPDCLSFTMHFMSSYSVIILYYFLKNTVKLTGFKDDFSKKY